MNQFWFGALTNLNIFLRALYGCFAFSFVGWMDKWLSCLLIVCMDEYIFVFLLIWCIDGCFASSFVVWIDKWLFCLFFCWVDGYIFVVLLVNLMDRWLFCLFFWWIDGCFASCVGGWIVLLVLLVDRWLLCWWMDGQMVFLLVLLVDG